MDEPYRIPPQYSAASTCCCSTRSTARRTSTSTSSVGSIFSILRAPNARRRRRDAERFPAARRASRSRAGYAIYGPSTMLVLTVGNGMHGFTLDPLLGEFMLTHPRPAHPGRHARVRDQRVEQPLLGAAGQALRRRMPGRRDAAPRGKDFNMRWIASLVAEAHRILMRGGVFMYPRDSKDPAQARPPAPALRSQPDRAC